MHINLPFQGDDELGRLHAAVRLVLPLLPALAASSPIVENRKTGLLDNRLEFYRNNARRIPSVAGRVVPERVFTRADYERQILAAIARDVAPYDPDETLEPEWTNSRGAIARFVRDAIEIRVIDTQECPRADLAVAAATVATVRALVEERWCSQSEQRAFEVDALADLFETALRDGDAAVVNHTDTLRCFGVSEASVRMGELWAHLIAELIPEGSEHVAPLRHIARNGCLARRIVARLGDDDSPESVVNLYRELCDCLSENRLFV
jgi:gamma-glutamyl:cysteine ligase YbdK (ATP-grasp superfamily)